MEQKESFQWYKMDFFDIGKGGDKIKVRVSAKGSLVSWPCVKWPWLDQGTSNVAELSFTSRFFQLKVLQNIQWSRKSRLLLNLQNSSSPTRFQVSGHVVLCIYSSSEGKKKYFFACFTLLYIFSNEGQFRNGFTSLKLNGFDLIFQS